MSGKPPASKLKTEGKSSASVDEAEKNPKARAASTACIWDDTRFKGDVRIGDYTIVGPGCCCISTNGGAIHIGSQNVLTEGVQIINKSRETMEISNCNIFETGSKVEARKIGSYNLFGAQSYVMTGCKIGNGCVIGPQMQVIKGKRVVDSTIMAGENLIQIQKTFKQRNSMYVQSMVKLLTRQFKANEKAQKNHLKNVKAKRKHASTSRDGRQRYPRPDGGRPNTYVPRSDGGRQTISGSSRYRKDNTRLATRPRGERRRTTGSGQRPRADKQ